MLRPVSWPADLFKLLSLEQGFPRLGAAALQPNSARQCSAPTTGHLGGFDGRTREARPRRNAWNFEGYFALFQSWENQKAKIDQQSDRCNGSPRAGAPNRPICALITCIRD